MIKFIRSLHQKKPLILIILCAPVLGFFFRGRFQFDVVPENPYPKFQVRLQVPHRTASEIEARVTLPAEKHFNGLPGLLSMESETLDHEAHIDLIFRQTISPEKAYLFVQEKLDQIRLEVPRDVEAIKVDRIMVSGLADVKFIFRDPVPIETLKGVLQPSMTAFHKVVPDISQALTLKVMPDPIRLAKEGLSVSDFTESLKVVGMSTELGKQEGITFGIGKGYNSTEDLAATVVGSHGNRPITLREVASVEVRSPGTTQEVSIWFDEARNSINGIRTLLNSMPVSFITRRPALYMTLKECTKPFLALAVIMLLQLIFFRVTFGRGLRIYSLLIFDGLISIHFLFWRGVVVGNISILDLHTLIITLITGTVFWMILFGRIRCYFLPQLKLKKIPMGIEQANLFSMGELLPSFLLLCTVLWLFSLPILLSDINLSSQYVARGFFMTGIPVLLCILTCMPILTHFDWITASQIRMDRGPGWRPSSKITPITMFLLHASALAAVPSLYLFPLGVMKQPHSSMDEYRGHTRRLQYLSTQVGSTMLSENLVPFNTNEFRPYENWEFTPSGLRYLGELKISSFEPAVEQLASEQMFGFLGEDSSRIALRFGGLGIQSGDFGNLLIAPVDRKNKRAKPIRVLASANVKIAPSRILRNRMVRADQVMLDSRRLNDNLKKTPPTVSPSQWTQYLLSQISRFNQLHFLAIVFFGLLLSLYLNHFLRAGILIICGLAMSALVLSPYSITRTAYHIDSLWLLHYVPWLGLVGYVVISRIIDVERSRGNDRDLAVQDARIQFAPTVMMALAFAVIALCVLGILERIPRFSGLGLWHEALWLSAVGVIVVLAMGYHLFPVIYLKSEEILDNLAYWLIRLPIIGKVLRRV